jgi:glycosyltransferase involved in cell wall biosynthesis
MSKIDTSVLDSKGRRPKGMDQPLRVTHIVLSLDTGGLERIVVDLVRVGRDHGLVSSVICLEKPGTLAGQVEALGVPVLCAEKRPGLRFSTVARLLELLRQLKPDVIHTHQLGPLLYTGLAARRVGIPVVIHTEHTNNVALARSGSRRIRTRLLLGAAGALADHFCCVSDEIAGAVKAYRTVASRKVSVVLNGIDTDAFDSAGDGESLRLSLGIPRQVPVIGTVGRLNEIKRQDLLIRAFANLIDQDPKPRLLLVGDGPALDSLRQLVAGLGLSDRVHFAGYQARPEHYLHLMDIFALTSRHEGMPLAILEAWAAGRPVVASRVGGVPNLVTSGVNGLLFESCDEASLTWALNSLLARPDDARRLGECGRENVRSRFDLRVMAGAYERHYRDLLGEVGWRRRASESG